MIDTDQILKHLPICYYSLASYQIEQLKQNDDLEQCDQLAQFWYHWKSWIWLKLGGTCIDDNNIFT